jgi:hypothetical protein
LSNKDSQKYIPKLTAVTSTKNSRPQTASKTQTQLKEDLYIQDEVVEDGDFVEDDFDENA